MDPLLRALLLDARGDWDQAHRLVQDLESRDAAWVHAYLHRREGDLSNASYWYSRAGRNRPASSLDEEWEAIATDLVNRPNG
jgi:hypothetical protein